MKVLVDTSVWSLALRRRAGAETPAVQELRSLVDEGRVAMIGPIRQELLSGIRTPESFERLRDHLRPYPDEVLDSADFERAAEHFNTCRAQGVQGSNTDFLICAAAERRDLSILTTDADFARFAAILPIRLHGRVEGGQSVRRIPSTAALGARLRPWLSEPTSRTRSH